MGGSWWNGLPRQNGAVVGVDLSFTLRVVGASVAIDGGKQGIEKVVPASKKRRRLLVRGEGMSEPKGAPMAFRGQFLTDD